MLLLLEPKQSRSQGSQSALDRAGPLPEVQSQLWAQSTQAQEAGPDEATGPKREWLVTEEWNCLLACCLLIGCKDKCALIDLWGQGVLMHTFNP